MTIAELVRAVESKKRLIKLEAQNKAVSDYKLADLIGHSIARLHSSSSVYPDISEAYPTLFDSKKIEEEKQSKKDELSALRFKQFAQSYNDKFKKEVGKEGG
jgi:hypothetical protein